MDKESLYEQIIVNMNEALWVGDKKEKTVYANPKFCKMLGYSLDEIITWDFYAFLDKESKKIVKKENDKKRKNHINSSYEGNLLTKFGEKIPVLLSGVPLPNGETIFTMTNLSQLKKIEKEKCKMESIVSNGNVILNIIKNSHAMTFIWDMSKERYVQFVSDNINNLGYTPDDFYSKKISYFDLLHPDDSERVFDESNKYISINKKEFIQEYRLVKKNGDIIWVNDHTFLVEEADKSVHCGIILNITDRKKAEEKLLDMYKYLGIINRKISILLNVNKQKFDEYKKEHLVFITKSAYNISEAEICMLYKYNKKDKNLKLLSCNKKGVVSSSDNKIVSIKDSPVLKALIQSKKRIHTTIKEENIPTCCPTEDIDSFLLLPILEDGEVSHILFLGFAKGQFITTQELDFFDMFVLQIASLLMKFK